MNALPQTQPPSTATRRSYELRFRSLFQAGRAYSFPCDEQDHVDMDTLSDRARDNYLYARALVGIELASPAVQVSAVH